MLYAGLDLSRQRLDVHVLDEEGRTVEVSAVHPDADALRTLAGRVLRHGQEVSAVIESMTGSRFVHDTLERFGWEVAIADPEIPGPRPLRAHAGGPRLAQRPPLQADRDRGGTAHDRGAPGPRQPDPLREFGHSRLPHFDPDQTARSARRRCLCPGPLGPRHREPGGRGRSGPYQPDRRIGHLLGLARSLSGLSGQEPRRCPASEPDAGTTSSMTRRHRRFINPAKRRIFRPLSEIRGTMNVCGGLWAAS